MNFDEWYEKNKEVLAMLSNSAKLSRAFEAGLKYVENLQERRKSPEPEYARGRIRE